MPLELLTRIASHLDSVDVISLCQVGRNYFYHCPYLTSVSSPLGNFERQRGPKWSRTLRCMTSTQKLFCAIDGPRPHECGRTKRAGERSCLCVRVCVRLQHYRGRNKADSRNGSRLKPRERVTYLIGGAKVYRMK